MWVFGTSVKLWPTWSGQTSAGSPSERVSVNVASQCVAGRVGGFDTVIS